MALKPPTVYTPLAFAEQKEVAENCGSHISEIAPTPQHRQMLPSGRATTFPFLKDLFFGYAGSLLLHVGFH